MKPEQIRVGVIGCGRFMRRQHAQTIGRSDALVLHHLADKDTGALEQVARRYKPARTSTNWRDVVGDGEVDVVVAGVDPKYHARIALAALQAGKPIYVEKPIAETIEAALAIQRVWRRTGVPVAVGFNRRFAPAVKMLSEIFASTARPVSILYRISDDGRINPPQRAWKKQDRLLIELVHIFDLLSFLLGSAPAAVYAVEARFNDAVVTVQFADGSCASILSSSYGSLAQPKEQLEAVLDRAAVQMDDFVEVRTYGLAGFPQRSFFPGRSYDGCDNSYVEAFAERGLAAYLQLRKRYNDAMVASGVLTDSGDAEAWRRASGLLGDPPPPQINYCADKGWAEALESFCRCAAAGNKPPNADAADAARATACALAGRRSIGGGKPIRLDPARWLA